jgi:hypothetical protein
MKRIAITTSFLGWLMSFFAFSYLGCGSGTSLKYSPNRIYLFKTQFDTSKYSYGSHIEIRQDLPYTEELIPMSIDDRDIIARSGYERKEIISILGEYLSFRGDTSTSNKRYHFKAAHHMTPPDSIENFTVQIEALYSFTRVLMVGYPPIRPMLINRYTGEVLNANPEAVKEIFDIYLNWYKKNRQSGFKDIILPLESTKYSWFGGDKLSSAYLKKNL